MLNRSLVYTLCGFLFASCPIAAADSSSGQYLYAWTGDMDKAEGDRDFLATIDVDKDSPTYGKVISTTPVAEVGTMPHHIEPSISSDNKLYASGFMANKIYLFDMSDAKNPTLEKTISQIPGWSMSHSFIRTPKNNMLATLQYEAGNKEASGGLAVFDPDGGLVDTQSVGDANFDGPPIRSYGLDVAPEVDRMVMTSTPMAMESPSSDVVQVYRLSDLKLLHTLPVLPPEGASHSKHPRSKHPFEIRTLADGKTAMLNTFQCGFYTVNDLDTSEPTVSLVYAMKKDNQRACSVPSIVGDYWVMPVQKSNEVVVLDISDLDNVHEAFVLQVGEGFSPHYAVAEPGSNRIALTGFMGKDARVMMMLIDQETGALSWDESFIDPRTGNPGVDFKRASWPHGDTGPAMPHGMVWSVK